MEVSADKLKKFSKGSRPVSDRIEVPRMPETVLHAVLEQVPVNVMIANLDGVITYLNRQSIETLLTLEDSLPVKVSDIIGGSYDVFHKAPAHQRKLLASDRNLPHRAIINVGKDKLDLLANPIYDTEGKYMGPMVTWSVVTEKLKLEEEVQNQKLVFEALSKAQAVIEFSVDGIIQSANDNFCRALGYTFEEIKGKHHSLFCDPKYVSSPAYREFWMKLSRGEFQVGEFKRITKLGKELWIQASYNPVYDAQGKLSRVVKYASDITKQKIEFLDVIKTLGQTAHQLASASEELTATATQLAANARKTTEKSTSAAASSEEVSKGVRSVATNTEEMVSSIKEISRSSTEAAGISKQAMAKANETNTTINQLGEASKEIGNVVKVISSIAQQTNLLALNATIEAARAGDAGKGFAVVANEVKELAKQTAKATEEITNKIAAIQDSSKGAVVAIGGIGKVIEQINSISMTIAAAVEEQTATTNEVSRVVQESNSAVEGIADTVKSVASSAQESAAGAGQTLDAARELAHLATTLRELVKRVEGE